MTSSYQSASSAAFDRATECRIAEEEVERLKGQLDLGMKQRDLFLEAVSAKDKGELRKMKEELSMALELNRRTQGLRKKASLWESYLAEKEAREEEEEKRAEEEALEREKADKMRRAMLPNEEDMEERRRAAMALDAGMDTESSDYDSEDGYVNDPDVFRCLWRPGCDHLFPSRLVRFFSCSSEVLTSAGPRGAPDSGACPACDWRVMGIVLTATKSVPLLHSSLCASQLPL